MRKFLVLISLAASACGASALEAVPGVNAVRSPTETNLQGRIGRSALVSARQQGINRICTYRAGPVGSTVRTHRVGLSDQCPAQFPTSDPNVPIPPTAQLQETTIQRGVRDCVYAQGAGRWTINLALEVSCPLSAGMAMQAQSASADEPDERQRLVPNDRDQQSGAEESGESEQPDDESADNSR